MKPSNHCELSLPPRAIRRALIAIALGAAGGVALVYYGTLLAQRDTPVTARTTTLVGDARQQKAAAAPPFTAEKQESSLHQETGSERSEKPCNTAPPDLAAHDDLKDQLQRIQADYRELSEQIYEHSAPLIEPTDRAALTLLQNEKRTDLARVLSPGEVELFEAKLNESPAPKRR